VTGMEAAVQAQLEAVGGPLAASVSITQVPRKQVSATSTAGPSTTAALTTTTTSTTTTATQTATSTVSTTPRTPGSPLETKVKVAGELRLQGDGLTTETVEAAARVALAAVLGVEGAWSLSVSFQGAGGMRRLDWTVVRQAEDSSGDHRRMAAVDWRVAYEAEVDALMQDELKAKVSALQSEADALESALIDAVKPREDSAVIRGLSFTGEVWEEHMVDDTSGGVVLRMGIVFVAVCCRAV